MLPWLTCQKVLADIHFQPWISDPTAHPNCDMDGDQVTRNYATQAWEVWVDRCNYEFSGD
jgi:hypothetical protein